MRAGLRSRPWVGIDVGDWSIKLVASMGARHWIAETRNIVPEHERETQGGRERVAKLVAEGMSRMGFTPRSFRGVTLGIAGPDVIIKQITLPYMDEDEVGPALRFESRKHLPFDPQGMVIDFQIVGRSITGKRLDILLAAVSQERLERLTMPLRLLGIDPDIVDAAPLALTNAMLHQQSQQPETRMMLDLGHAASHLILYQRVEPFFARRIEFGGKSVTNALSRGMKIPFEEAERWIVSLSEDGPARVNWELPEMRFVFDALRLDLLEEIKRSVAFYRTIGQLNEPTSMWISGGLARLPGLSDQLAQLLEAPVKVFDPLTSLDGQAETIEPLSRGPQFTQALGLALRSA